LHFWKSIGPIVILPLEASYDPPVSSTANWSSPDWKALQEGSESWCYYLLFIQKR
jgi:hypothetical protein